MSWRFEARVSLEQMTQNQTWIHTWIRCQTVAALVDSAIRLRMSSSMAFLPMVAGT
jgi:hypothetical protein